MIKHLFYFLVHFKNNPDYLVLVLFLNLILDFLIKLILTSHIQNSFPIFLVSGIFAFFCFFLLEILFLHYRKAKPLLSNKEEILFIFFSLNTLIIFTECGLVSLDMTDSNLVFEGIKISYIIWTFLNKFKSLFSKYFTTLIALFYLDFRLTQDYTKQLLYLLAYAMVWLVYLIITRKKHVPLSPINAKISLSKIKSNINLFKESDPKNLAEIFLGWRITSLLFQKINDSIIILDQNLKNLYQNKSFIQNFNFSGNPLKPFTFKALIKKIEKPANSTSFHSSKTKINYFKFESPKNYKFKNNQPKPNANLNNNDNNSNSNNKNCNNNDLNKIIDFEVFIKNILETNTNTDKPLSNNSLPILIKCIKLFPEEKPEHMILLYHYQLNNSNFLIIFSKNPSSAVNLMNSQNETIDAQIKLLSFVSHEFRTPLNCINAMLQTLEDAVSNVVYEQYIQPALSCCKYLMNMIQDLLDVSQMKAGKFKLQDRDFDLNPLLQDIFILFQVQAKAKQIDTSFEISPQVPKIINSDPNRLKQIIINLLSNAFKYTQKGSIRLSCDLQITEKAEEDCRIIKISVEDTGLGIQENDKPKLLKAFGKIEDQQNKYLNPQGVGLGLIISQDLASALAKNLSIPEDQKGLQFDSTYNEGSTFYFLFENKKEYFKNNENESLIEDYELESPEYNNKQLIKQSKEMKFLEIKPERLQTPYFPPLKNSEVKNKLITHALTTKDIICSVSFNKEKEKSVFFNKEKKSGSVFSNIEKGSNNFLDKEKNSLNSHIGVNLGKSFLFRNFSQFTIKSLIPDNINNKISIPSQLASFLSDMSISFTSNSKSFSSRSKMKIQKIKSKIDGLTIQRKCNCPDVLVCDDNSFNILALQYLLESFNQVFESCLSGDEAINKMKDFYYNPEKSCCKTYKIILLDIEMPYKDGLETCKEMKAFLKSVEKEKETNIVACTGYSDEIMNAKIKEAGFDDHLVKPILKGALMGILLEYLNEKMR